MTDRNSGELNSGGLNSGGLKETLSAMMDDEATDLEFLRASRALSQNPELRETWRRYQMARSAIRREASANLIDLSERIREAIAVEQLHEHPEVPVDRNRGSAGAIFAKPGGPLRKFAVAASVAAVTVLGAIQFKSGILGTAGDQLPTAPSLAGGVGDEAIAGPAMLQRPAVFAAPQVHLRAVSTTPLQRYGQSSRAAFVGYDASDLETDRQIGNYLQRLLREHAERETLRAMQVEGGQR